MAITDKRNLTEPQRIPVDYLTNLGEVRETACATCNHPIASHQRFIDDSGCYHTFGCTCLAYAPEPVAPFAATEPFPLTESDFED